ncbi:monocarboxylate transporter 12-B-like [Acanthaster planci]|uniref:Monocarboxylate transporter 12-B-like n=1 Tax=Acanthaster planci TaxID=133434 RepID=A0A8B7ZZS7_ACAPL|nr:monocarboxylate transporter 12-B-like [Acanthaster planci]
MAQDLQENRRSKRRGYWCLQDGGRIGWSAVLTLWVTWFTWDTLIKCLAIMLPTLTVQLQTRTWVLGWIVTMVDSCAEGMGTLAYPLSRCFSSGCILLVCGLMVGGGIIASSFVTSPIQLGIILLITASLGISVASNLTRKMIGANFSKQYVMANGWAQTGDSFALICIPPFTQLCLTTFGWRGNLQIIGAICLHLAACGVLLKRYEEPVDEGEPESLPLLPFARNPPDRTESKPLDELKSSNMKLLKNHLYWVTTLIAGGTHIAMCLWRIYFVPHAIVKGVAEQDAALVVTLVGTATLVLKILHGPIVDRDIMSSRTLLSITSLIATTGLIIDPWMNSYWQIVFCGIMVLPFQGISCNLSDVITKELLGANQLVNAFGCVGLKTAALRVAIGFAPECIDSIGRSGFTCAGYKD